MRRSSPLKAPGSIDVSGFVDSNCNLGGGTIVGRAGGGGTDAHAAITNLLRVQMRLGLFDALDSPRFARWNQLGAADVGSAADVVGRVPILRWIHYLGVVSAAKHSVLEQIRRGTHVGLVPDAVTGSVGGEAGAR